MWKQVIFTVIYILQKCSKNNNSFNKISRPTVTMDGVLSINPSVNLFVFGDFSVHHKDWLIYSAGTNKLGELHYNFSISNDLNQMVKFPTWIPVTLTVPLFWIIFFLLMLVFVLLEDILN